MQHATALIAVHRAKLEETHWQLTVAAQLRLVHLNMEGAIHRLSHVILPFHLHGGEHIFLVPTEMAARLPELNAPHMWRIYQLIAPAQVLLTPEALNQIADHCPFGMPEHQTRTHHLVNREQV